MQKVILKHLKGSKTNQTEMFDLPFTELVLGRDSSANIKFDPERDDLVSRKHAKIVHDSGTFKLNDLDSRNGTFVNGNRIQAPVILNVGDIIKLGGTGPEFSFDIDPRPENTARSTRFVSDSAQQTRESVASTRYNSQKETSISGKPSIGRATVERLLSENTSQTRKKIINITSGIVVVIILGASFLLYQSNKGQETLALALHQQEEKNELTVNELEQKIPTGLSATEIAAKYSNSTVYIEESWKLFDKSTGQQLFQAVGCITDKNLLGKCNDGMPIYIQVDSQTIEPFLVPKDGLGDKIGYEPIGVRQSGSGFVVTPDGFILTNRHVAAGWYGKYNDRESLSLKLPGLLLKCSSASGCKKGKELDLFVEFKEKHEMLTQDSEKALLLDYWTPYNQKTIGGVRKEEGKLVEGRNDMLEVTLPNTTTPILAQLVRVSETTDVALIKIQLPYLNTPVVELDSKDTLQIGGNVVVTGYPAIAANMAVKIESQDNSLSNWRTVRTPTVSVGTIGKVASKISGNTISQYYSDVGDLFQLNINTTGAGNSGGPVFNDMGQVIGIFTAGKFNSDEGTRITFATPIKYGRELMGK